MTSVETILLGVVQGLTEFLPVSSSGHLVIFKNILGFKEPELLLDVALHLGTLLAVCVYFRSDLRKMAEELWGMAVSGKGRGDRPGPYASLALMVVVGSFPTALIGITFKTPLERMFGSVSTVGVMLVITGIITGLTKFIPADRGALTRVGPLAALAIGTAQGLAIIPGISRSGSTIVCALLLGLNRDLAGRFSFLLSIPAIIGALLLQFEAGAIEKVGLVSILWGFASAALVGFMALKLLMGMVRKGHFYYFAPYCWAVGAFTIVLAWQAAVR
ncbi:MAG: undecaprenyl-diphosphate phosphatase [Deltaproteobacteria bacterium]|nr:undecaprenyl-diphosphate phosphatase [Deltaproteobacteria bacterium]MBW2048474.1 undecaprenyl-diphosphate phosphatase [Deltaproteobacteria bacterium]MBW2111060.1 undecaprenyl-diphosphate phosphatase [Deltaproteobacteria bacterium]